MPLQDDTETVSCTDVPASSQSVDSGMIGSASSGDVKTCLQLLYKIFHRAVFALTLNK